MGRDFMTIRDAAGRLGLSYERTYALVVSGVLPFKRRGGRWVSPVRAWEQWLDQQAEEALAGVREVESASR